MQVYPMISRDIIYYKLFLDVSCRTRSAKDKKDERVRSVKPDSFFSHSIHAGTPLTLIDNSSVTRGRKMYSSLSQICLLLTSTRPRSLQRCRPYRIRT